MPVRAEDNKSVVVDLKRRGAVDGYDAAFAGNARVFKKVFDTGATLVVTPPLPLAELRRLKDILHGNLADVEQAIEYEPGDRRIACRKGCHFCCFQHVMVSTIGFAMILDHLIEHPAEAARITARAREFAPKVDRLGRAGRYTAGIPCPALGHGGLCTIYEARPEACRTYFSMSRTACEVGWRKRHRPAGSVRGAPIIVEPQAFGHILTIGLDAGFLAGGFEVERVELTGALAFAADQPGGLAGTLERWLAGEHQFGSIAEIEPIDQAGLIALETYRWGPPG